MKYSIVYDQDISNAPITLNSKYSKTFTHFLSTTNLQITHDNHLKLKHLINQYGQQMQESKAMKNMQIQINLQQQLKWQNIRLVWPGQQQWILFFQKPFQIYFVLNKYSKIIPIKFDQQIDIIHTNFYVNYPQVIFYGHRQSTFTNHTYSFNLTTFEFKEITSSTNYHPGNRSNYWSFISDNRLYIYGGINKHNKQMEQLFWTFNIENGNWFALDMPSNQLHLQTYALNCEIESGKVLVLSNNSLLLVELYQSRVNEVQGWKQLIQYKKINNITGYYIYKGQIYFHNNERLIPLKIRINKIKINK